MPGKNRTRLIGWHPSDPSLVTRLAAEIKRRGGGRGTQREVLDEALADWLDKHDPETTETTEER